MAEELRWVLIIISTLVIGSLLVHGLWSVRKKQEAQTEQPKTQRNERAERVHRTDRRTRDIEPQVSPLDIDMDQPEQMPLLSPNEAPTPGLESTDESTTQAAEAQATTGSQAPVAQPQDFIIVHLQMPSGLTMQGSSLLPLVLTLGFKYSEEGFFNRHVAPSGDGPVLFSLVNMFNPGTFDVDNMEQFSTEGVSLFMTLPCEGDPLPAFNMLHSAAKKLSDEFGAEILDHNRQPLTVATVRKYVEKIREFNAI